MNKPQPVFCTKMSHELITYVNRLPFCRSCVDSLNWFGDKHNLYRLWNTMIRWTWKLIRLYQFWTNKSIINLVRILCSTRIYFKKHVKVKRNVPNVQNPSQPTIDKLSGAAGERGVSGFISRPKINVSIICRLLFYVFYMHSEKHLYCVLY